MVMVRTIVFLAIALGMTRTAANPVSLRMTNVAVPPVVGGNSVASRETGHVFVVRSSTAFNYEADRNVLSDGGWNYSWDVAHEIEHAGVMI